MASNASDEAGGFPLALAAAFCASIAWRTAWSPPRRSCSATGICSGRRPASMALRWTVDVGMVGRSPRDGRPSASPGRRPPGRRGPPPPRGRSLRSPRSARSARSRDGRSLRSPRAPRSVRSPRSASGPPRRPPRRSRRSSSRRREPGARTTETSGARFGVPRTSMRPSVFSGERAGLAGERVRISMPSKPTSTSARRTDPTLSPAGTREPSTTPLGWRAPAARQVQLPSGVWLVSSMSIPRDMRRTRYRARLAAPTAEPGPASRNMVRCPQRRGVFPRGARRPP